VSFDNAGSWVCWFGFGVSGPLCSVLWGIITGALFLPRSRSCSRCHHFPVVVGVHFRTLGGCFGGTVGGNEVVGGSHAVVVMDMWCGGGDVWYRYV